MSAGSVKECPIDMHALIKGYCIGAALLTDILAMTAIVRSIGPASAGIQCGLASPTGNIIHEDGKCRVGSEIGVALCHRPRPGQAQLTAHNPGVERVAVPVVITDSTPLPVTEVDLKPTRCRVGATGESHGFDGQPSSRGQARRRVHPSVPDDNVR